MKAIRLLSVALVAVACGSVNDGAATPQEPSTTTSTTSVPTTTIDLEVEEPMPDETELVDAAMADLIQRLAVTSDDVELVQSREVTWPDGAMGCPKEGESYTQAQVDGTELILGANGRVYIYHSGPDGQVWLCPSGDKDGGYDFVPSPGFDE